jgi:AcrR family transcriptional regulator
MARSSLRDRHTADTKSALMSAARKLFATQGYHKTSTDQILEVADVSRGSLYHHFSSKQEIFYAVFEDLERELVETFEREFTETFKPGSSVNQDSWEVLCWVARQYIARVAEDQELRQITIIDAPAVLSWEQWREHEHRLAIADMGSLVEEAVQGGILPPVSPTAIVHLILGALEEGVQYVANAKDREAKLKETQTAITLLLESLRLDSR